MGDKVKKWDPRRYVELSSPLTLGFSLLCLLALALQGLTGGASTRALFSIYRASPADPLGYLRLFLHVLGHNDFAHLAANMGLFLVLGPTVEKLYGWRRLLMMIALTALVTGLLHLLLSAHAATLGASGIVFMLIMLSAVSGRRSAKVPLTLILVALLYLGREIAGGLFQPDNISQLAHIAGGACGIIFGLKLKQRQTPG